MWGCLGRGSPEVKWLRGGGGRTFAVGGLLGGLALLLRSCACGMPVVCRSGRWR